MKHRTLAPAITFSLALIGCSGDESQQTGSPPAGEQAAGQNAATTPANPHAANPHAANPHAGLAMGGVPGQLRNGPTGAGETSVIGGGRGKVKEALHAGGYTYVEVDAGGHSLWLATTETSVQAGQEIGWRDGAMMRDFYSKALDRRFDQVMFITSILPPGGVVQANMTQGVVLSAQEAAGYVYLEVDTEQGRTWLAAPARPVGIGKRVAWSDGQTMSNFHSNALNRTFDSIQFVGGVTEL